MRIRYILPAIKRRAIVYLFFQTIVLIIFLGTATSKANMQAKASPRLIHVIVALCDNEHQGIYPVSATLGDGDSPRTNLYWGALYGVRTYFDHQPEWKCVSRFDSVSAIILQRVVYECIDSLHPAILIADAYHGERIDSAMNRFIYEFSALAKADSVKIDSQSSIDLARSDLVVYVGHEGLMDFTLPLLIQRADSSKVRPDVMALACYSREFLGKYIQRSGASPMLLSTGLCSPEAYTLEAAIKGWLKGESKQDIRTRAAEAYNKYQKCGLRAAKNLWVN